MIAKGEKMKLQKLIHPLLIMIGLGAAMSVALKDTSVGMAIGAAAAIALTSSNSKCTPETK